VVGGRRWRSQWRSVGEGAGGPGRTRSVQRSRGPPRALRFSKNSTFGVIMGPSKQVCPAPPFCQPTPLGAAVMRAVAAAVYHIDAWSVAQCNEIQYSSSLRWRHLCGRTAHVISSSSSSSAFSLNRGFYLLNRQEAT